MCGRNEAAMSDIVFEQVNENTWKSGFLAFRDLGRNEGGITHRYEVWSGAQPVILGWVVWKSAWRRYTFKPVTGYDTWFDSLCLTTIATFVTLRTDERKAQWGQQGRYPDR